MDGAAMHLGFAGITSFPKTAASESNFLRRAFGGSRVCRKRSGQFCYRNDFSKFRFCFQASASLEHSISLVATVGQGIEALVKREIEGLNVAESLKAENGRCRFLVRDGPAAAAKSLLGLRCAHRLYALLKEFPASTFDEVYEAVASIPWEDWFNKDVNVTVLAKSTNSKLLSKVTLQRIGKKALVDRLQRKFGSSLPETGPTAFVVVSIQNDLGEILLDLGGRDGLHKRGYRELVGVAPLKETLASAMLSIAWWKPHRPLLDPFCGSGTIPIEAALKAFNIAPGLDRSFDCEDWPWMPRGVFDTARQEARDHVTIDREVEIFGSDVSSEAIQLAEFHAKNAGLPQRSIRFRHQDVSEIKGGKFSPYGCIITNPPYGERTDPRDVRAAYRDLRNLFDGLDQWSIFVIASRESGFERVFGRKPTKTRKVYNGRIVSDILQWFGPLPPRLPRASPSSQEDSSSSPAETQDTTHLTPLAS
mmetsp:Transcript_16655/g.27560  ORF Transcript_16655/g.27560 Transcript_16655/m.27560 type:complete len:477 (-) Transcript_16655:579-2009(-)